MTLAGLIAQAYPSPEWAVFFEVSNSTGFGVSRRADAVALGVWPSRGNALVGFEFKEDRRDWLREHKNPAKAETIAAHCDSWYVVAGSESVVSPEELPEPWGLYVANKERTRLMNKKTCVPFEDRNRAVISRTFAAAMLRKVGETTVPKVELARLVNEAVQAAIERTREGHDLKHLQDQVQRHNEIFDQFKAVTGLDIRQDWRGPKQIAKAVNALLSSDSHRDQLSRMADLMGRTVKEVREVLANWPTTVEAE